MGDRGATNDLWTRCCERCTSRTGFGTSCHCKRNWGKRALHWLVGTFDVRIPYFAVYKPRLVLVFSPDFFDFTAIEAAMHGARLPVHGPPKIQKVFLRLLFQIRLIHGKIRYMLCLYRVPAYICFAQGVCSFFAGLHMLAQGTCIC